MVLKLINANEAKPGVTVLVDGEACVVKSNDISKTGKHGHMKCRIEALSVIDGRKKVFVIGGHERMDVPMIAKKRAQILTANGNMANVMDLESFETFDAPLAEELVGQLNSGDQAEYWIIEDKEKIIKKKF